LHVATAGGYGYQRDELYFISCAHHLAWGYVDQPPLIAVIAKVALWLFGDSLYGVRLLPALAAAGTVVLAGRMTRRLGGGLLAQTLAMLGVALAPFNLAVGDLLTMNAFEPLLWFAAAYLFTKADETDSLPLWTALGVISGLGLVNKYSMFFFLGSCTLAVALTPARRSLIRPGYWLAVAIAAVIVSPTLVWQAQHGWPQLEVLRNAARGVNNVAGPFAFFAQQILMMNPVAAPIWIAGLYSLLFAPQTKHLRWYGLTYVVLSLVYLALGAKIYYMAPIYPMLFAAGAPVLEKAFLRVRRMRFARHAPARAPLAIAYPLLLLVGGLAVAPEAFPLLPLPAFLAYQHVLDFRGIKMERHPQGRVPQQFADQLGWDTLVSTFAGVYDRLGPAEQRDAVILTRDYGQASAIDFLGPKYHLPHAISGHNNYYLYGTRGASGRLVLAIGISKQMLQAEFRSVRAVATYHDPYVLPDFNDLPIYACSQPIQPLAAWWPATKHYI
jgi:hypothetical protein